MRDYVKNSKNVKANIRFSEIDKRIERAKEDVQRQMKTDLAVYRRMHDREKKTRADKRDKSEEAENLESRSSPQSAQDFFDKFMTTYEDKWLEEFKKSVGDFK